MNELDAIVSLVSLWQDYETQTFNLASQPHTADDSDQKRRWLDAKTSLYECNNRALDLIQAASSRAEANG